MVNQDFISRMLNPLMMNNYGQNVLGSTYNSAEFVFGKPGPYKCQVIQPFAATCNINPVDFAYVEQIPQIRASCPEEKEEVEEPVTPPSPPSPVIRC